MNFLLDLLMALNLEFLPILSALFLCRLFRLLLFRSAVLRVPDFLLVVYIIVELLVKFNSMRLSFFFLPFFVLLSAFRGNRFSLGESVVMMLSWGVL